MISHASISECIARLREFIRSTGGRKDSCEQEFNELALELFAWQFARNEAYRRLCEVRGTTPARVRSWRDIPAAPTSAFKEWEMTCLRPEERERVFYSSGTTEQRPSRHFHNQESLEIYEASLLKWFEGHLLDGKEEAPRLLFLTPRAKEAPRSSLVHMFEIVDRELGRDQAVFGGKMAAQEAWELDLPGVIASLDGAVISGEPLMLLGTAFNFVHLVDYLESAGKQYELPRGSRVMETGGYKGRSRALAKSELHALITARLGVPRENIICEYGMSELGSQAYDRVYGAAAGESRIFQFPPWARVRVISPETGADVKDGEIGLIRVYDLANVHSVIGVQTEDLGVRRGAGFELLGRAAEAERRGCSLMSA